MSTITLVRTITLERKTNETNIKLTLDLDGTGKFNIHTGVGFFDHMLSHIAVHGMIDLDLHAEGDLEVDAHHTIEDCALVMGSAIDQALGDRRSINRMGSAYVPMDESLAFVAIDLSGRPYTVMQTEWHSSQVGSMPSGTPTSLVNHFFESLAVSARMNLHARVLYGRDDHHQAEALFKALGRALDSAVRIDPRREVAGSIPSTKGTL